MNRRSLLLGLSGTALLAAAGGWSLLRPNAEGLWASPALAQETTGGAANDLLPDVAMGAADAPVTLIEYASFTCGHCANFHETVFKPLKREYIDTGKVRFILREAYFDGVGLWAGQVAQCGGDLKYYGIVDMLFDEQSAWIGDGQPQTIGDNLRKIGLRAGLTKEQIEACLNDTARAERMVATYQAHFTADGIEGTPTLMINGKKHSNMSYESLKKILDAELAG
ncbi:thiol-disulfide oxidoreductase [Rhodobacter sp. TJ_12]|uniref:DsbA family protein n=1 Tax=Rhodobacter sp. TJ_12 TaxID=2029399 RepID=UPI001CBC7F9B|nr:DsbA family protein [Rhodobacter sp. TJ_12]MBZ4020932.1 thiol-disulfide oxidoreductase [Rhodobacter sp. TJ_12]